MPEYKPVLEYKLPKGLCFYTPAAGVYTPAAKVCRNRQNLGCQSAGKYLCLNRPLTSDYPEDVRLTSVKTIILNLHK